MVFKLDPTQGRERPLNVRKRGWQVPKSCGLLEEVLQGRLGTGNKERVEGGEIRERGRDQIKCFGSRSYNILEAKGLAREDGKGNGVVTTHQVCGWRCH